VPAPAPVSSAPAAPATKPPAADQTLFGQALRKLRAANDAASALAALREHGKAFPGSALAGERKALEVEALLALHREREALALLDTMAIDELPRGGERLVVRGELRAAANRWLEAQTDFDRALARVSGSPAWHERALWGRGVSRLRLGEREAGLADVERYLDTYPKGRFAAEAAKFFPGR
jgi:tetratricopeptide (TPR) repeat protein